MEIIRNPNAMQEIAIGLFKRSVSVGFVPTMGALHDGHVSLIEASLHDNDQTIVSVFINPTQFGPDEDLSSYPHPIDEDIERLRSLHVDYLFLPTKEDIYPQNYSSYLEVQGLTNRLCGLSRPTHFRGVTTICSILFHLTLPTLVYFGQKDYQQTLVIERLVNDLHFPINIKVMPIVRDKDGLALSSRNQYLSESERIIALGINQSLGIGEDLIHEGERNVHLIKKAVTEHLSKSKDINIDYISICHPKTLIELTHLTIGKVFIALSVYLGGVRLIDNRIVKLAN